MCDDLGWGDVGFNEWPAPDGHGGIQIESNKIIIPNRADRPGLNEFDHAAIVVVGVVLRSHLRDHVCVAGRHANDARFFDVVSQRLFAVDMLA